MIHEERAGKLCISEADYSLVDNCSEVEDLIAGKAMSAVKQIFAKERMKMIQENLEDFIHGCTTKSREEYTKSLFTSLNISC